MAQIHLRYLPKHASDATCDVTSLLSSDEPKSELRESSIAFSGPDTQEEGKDNETGRTVWRCHSSLA